MNTVIKNLAPCGTDGRLLLSGFQFTRDLDLGSGHTAYGRASLIDLYLHTKFHWNRKKTFLDGLTAWTPPSSRSRDTKTRTNFKNPARWQQINCDVCACGEPQTMSHILDSCPLTKLAGGLSKLHSGDDDAVAWLTNYGGPLRMHTTTSTRTWDLTSPNLTVSRQPKIYNVWHQPPEGISRTRYLLSVIVYPCSYRLWLDFSNFRCWEKTAFQKLLKCDCPWYCAYAFILWTRQRLLLMTSDAMPCNAGPLWWQWHRFPSKYGM